MQQYLDLLRRVLSKGKLHENRTGIPTIRTVGEMLSFDLRDGFPAVTTKKLAFGQVKGELLGFIRGYTNAQAFRNLGCTIWDANANENKQWLANPNRQFNDDLGRIYGAQWRGWYDNTCGRTDQLANAVDQIRNNPSSRRIIVNAWRPDELDHMALPPCHVMHQYHVDQESGTLSLTMYQRSCDLFLGVPFNIASYALLLELMARATDLQAAELTMFLADAHIYTNHLDQVECQLSREPLDLPEVCFDPEVGRFTGITMLEKVMPDEIWLKGYNPYPAIPEPMAV